jgi:hypothetical protein
VVLSIGELKLIAEARIEDAQILIDADRLDGAFYLCSYAVEIGLKFKICKTLNWKGYPSTNKEFSQFQSFKTHNLEVLLSLSGIEEEIKQKFLTEWSDVVEWVPEIRYEPIGKLSKNDVNSVIESAYRILERLWKD